MPPPVVEASGLRHVHPSGRVGLASVDVTVPPGRRVVVMGPNGSGKTTLLRVLSTALRPSAGRLRLLGHPVPPAPPSLRRRIGVVLDRSVHLEAVDGLQNALLFASAAGVEPAEGRRRLEPLLERFSLSEAAGDPLSAWSFGMRRRLLLVEALLPEPALLVLDEPSLGLDPGGVDALVRVLDERAASGAAVVAAINDPAVAARIADRVVMLDEGRVVADGVPEELLDAVGGGLRCSVDVEGSPGEAARLLRGIPDVRAEAREGGIEARLGEDASSLPELVAALVEGGVAVRSVRIRETDLGDVFRARTGRALGSGAQP